MRINFNVFQSFLRSGSGGSLLLFLCLVLSLIVANSPLAADFGIALEARIGPFTTTEWINDVLMSVFFLMVGLEIKRELVEGELASLKRASLPVIAAFGGAVTPALIFAAINRGTPAIGGWGIPMATDIAFALAALSLLGKQVPASLKIFLAALAIVDDLIAILVIAIFYTAKLEAIYLLLAAGILGVLFVFNRIGLKSLWFYLLPGCLVWLCVHQSGVHATIAGVLLAMTLPTTPGSEESPLEKLECLLGRPVNFIILPLFALANTAIRFDAQLFRGLGNTLGLGVMLGLVFGKPLGITLSSMLAIRLRIAKLPRKARWSQLIGVGVLGGIGFTMSTFIALLSFAEPALQAEAKCAVLVASTIAAVSGIIVLRLYRSKAKTAMAPIEQPLAN